MQGVSYSSLVFRHFVCKCVAITIAILERIRIVSPQEVTRKINHSLPLS